MIVKSLREEWYPCTDAKGYTNLYMLAMYICGENKKDEQLNREGGWGVGGSRERVLKHPYTQHTHIYI